MNKKAFVLVALAGALAFAASLPTDSTAPAGAVASVAPFPITDPAGGSGTVGSGGSGSADPGTVVVGPGSGGVVIDPGTGGGIGSGSGGGGGTGSGSIYCVLSDRSPENAGDGEFEYTGDELGCIDYAATAAVDTALDYGEYEAAQLFATAFMADGKKIDNRVTDPAKIEKAKENHAKHSELLTKNKERIAAILEKPATMPPPGEKNPLGITLERFKLAVEGGRDGARVALHFRDTPAGNGEPARTAKENQDKMAAELKEAMAKINERLQKQGAETLGDFQFVIIGSGTTFFSNNHTKALPDGEPKVFGQKTTSADPVKNEKGTWKDLDMDIQLTCPGMVEYVANKPHELNEKITRYLGEGDAIYNLFKSSGDKGVLSKHFPELQEVVTRWTALLGIGEVDIKLVTDTAISGVGAAPGPILLVGGP